MKRYKVVEEVEVIANGIYAMDTDYVIPAGTEIVLEEVKEEKEMNKSEWLDTCIYCKDGCRFSGSRCFCNCHQPKEEKCTCLCHVDDVNFIEHRCPCAKDQPLTPKDCGMRKGQAIYCFRQWLIGKSGWDIDRLFSTEDEEFDRLYQKFLSEYKK